MGLRAAGVSNELVFPSTGLVFSHRNVHEFVRWAAALDEHFTGARSVACVAAADLAEPMSTPLGGLAIGRTPGFEIAARGSARRRSKPGGRMSVPARHGAPPRGRACGRLSSEMSRRRGSNSAVADAFDGRRLCHRVHVVESKGAVYGRGSAWCLRGVHWRRLAWRRLAWLGVTARAAHGHRARRRWAGVRQLENSVLMDVGPAPAPARMGQCLGTWRWSGGAQAFVRGLDGPGLLALKPRLPPP